MRPEWVAAFDVGLAVMLQISVAKRKKLGTLEPWIPWQAVIIGLHLMGLTFLAAVLPGKTSVWLAESFVAASLASFAYFAFSVLRNGPVYRRQQALLQKQQEASENSPVAATVTSAAEIKTKGYTRHASNTAIKSDTER